MKINTLVVDDDLMSAKLIAKFVELTAPLHLVGTCSSAIEAYAVLIEQSVGLLICDIEMPELSGLAFARSLQNGPLIMS